MSRAASFLPGDADCDFFLGVLSHTSIGERYHKALLVMRLMALEIRIMRWELARGRMPKAEADHWIADRQGMYAKYSRRASVALDELNLLYDWPPESKVARAFIWEPPSAAR